MYFGGCFFGQYSHDPSAVLPDDAISAIVLVVGAEDRGVVVALEDRAIAVAAESRSIVIGLEDLTLGIAAEDRSITVADE